MSRRGDSTPFVRLLEEAQGRGWNENNCPVSRGKTKIRREHILLDKFFWIIFFGAEIIELPDGTFKHKWQEAREKWIMAYDKNPKNQDDFFRNILNQLRR